MGVEERFPDIITERDESEDFEEALSPGLYEKQQQRLRRRYLTVIERFLGKGRRTHTTAITPRYYWELLTWALHQHLGKEGWEIIGTLGYSKPEPVYTDVNTGNETVNLLVNGQLLVEKGESRFIITTEISPRWPASVQLEGIEEKKEEMEEFIAAILAIMEERNFYRGRKIEFSSRIRFLDVANRSWDSIMLDAQTKKEIMANSVEFLKRSAEWRKYGIPLKRGILLAGEPGTGKTIICKSLMAEAEKITCITTNGYALDIDDYITELYELAQDLAPSIVFVEDIDLIGQNRLEFGYQRGPALLSLLATLDGIEEQKEIVTVATTNCLETLDKALSERPSRFDRVIKLTCPSLEQRKDLVRCLSQKIPLDDNTQEYIACKAENCTPAQLQEIVYSLVIQCQTGQSVSAFRKIDVDQAISRINDRSKHQLGFGGINHLDRKLSFNSPVTLNESGNAR